MNLTICNKCEFKQLNENREGYCYFFKEEPEDHCIRFLSKPSITSIDDRDKLKFFSKTSTIPIIEESLFPSQDSSLQSQVGGDHYKSLGEYQPWQVFSKWLTAEELQGYMKGTVIAYLCRNKENMREDIEKAKHTIELYLELSAKENKIVSSK